VALGVMHSGMKTTKREGRVFNWKGEHAGAFSCTGYSTVTQPKAAALHVTWGHHSIKQQSSQSSHKPICATAAVPTCRQEAHAAVVRPGASNSTQRVQQLLVLTPGKLFPPGCKHAASRSMRGCVAWRMTLPHPAYSTGTHPAIVLRGAFRCGRRADWTYDAPAAHM
jgi:hypothetical protein